MHYDLWCINFLDDEHSEQHTLLSIYAQDARVPFEVSSKLLLIIITVVWDL